MSDNNELKTILKDLKRNLRNYPELFKTTLYLAAAAYIIKQYAISKIKLEKGEMIVPKRDFKNV